MDRSRRTSARLFVARALQHSQHLKQPDTARAGRRRGDDLVAVITPAQRLLLRGLIGFQIRERDQASVGRHGRRQLLGGFAFIEVARAAIANALQRGSQIGLHELVTVMRGFQKDPLRFRKLREQLHFVFTVQRCGEAIGDGETLGGELQRRVQQLGPRLASVLLVRQLHAAHSARHTRGAPSHQTVLGYVAFRVQIHVARGRERGFLAKVDEGGPAIGEACEQESAAADVSRVRIGHRQREGDSHGGIDRIPARLQHPQAYVGG